MTQPDKDQNGRCRLGCRSCPTFDGSDGQKGGALCGWRLSVAALVVFLVPLILAIVGAMVAGSSQTARLIGAAAGLAVGITAAILAGRFIRPAGKGTK